ncbi:hypothetical protein ABPG75_005259 [Micractinium tetrahymenae]
MRTGALAAALLLSAALQTGSASAVFAGSPMEGPGSWDWPCVVFNQERNMCFYCDQGYSPDASGVCRECQPGCMACRPEDGCCYRCGQSPDGKHPMFLNTTTHTCQRCLLNPVSSGCTECNTRGRCTQCADMDFETSKWTNFFLVNGRCIRGKATRDVCYEANANGDCVDCSFGYALLNGRCKICPQGGNGGLCKRCDPKTLRCMACWEGSLQDGRCVPCKSQGCLDCAKDPNVCTRCYYITPDNEDPENDWSFYRVGGVCKRCTAPNCRNCKSDGTCRECKYDYNVVGGKCKLAPPVEDHFPCTNWDAKTKRCKVGPELQACYEGWWLNKKANSCDLCEDGCMRCTSGGPSWRQPGGTSRCTRCQKPDLYSYPGYALINGRCLECADPYCMDCDGNIRRCKRCYDDNLPYKVNSEGRCVLP